MTLRGLTFERRDAVAIVTIDDAPYNGMSVAFMNSMEALVADIAANDGIRAVVLTAAGGENFSVGMNLKELLGALSDKADKVRVDSILDQRLSILSAIENMDKPWIATLFGKCLGGGLELPLACHFRLAARDGARIGLPELNLGSVPAWGGSARLVRRIGRDRAIDMILRAKAISGPEALSLGLVTEVWPNVELKQRAVDLATELAALPRVAMAQMLRCLVPSEHKTLAESLRDERAAFHATLGTRDLDEGLTAYIEKRAPRFNQQPPNGSSRPGFQLLRSAAG